MLFVLIMYSYRKESRNLPPIQEQERLGAGRRSLLGPVVCVIAPIITAATGAVITGSLQQAQVVQLVTCFDDVVCLSGLILQGSVALQAMKAAFQHANGAFHHRPHHTMWTVVLPFGCLCP